MTERADPGIGGTLRRAREAQGLTLGEVAQQLKFAPRQLEALEEDRYDVLPGVTITRGMVRNYARLLKVDPEPLVAHVAARMQVPDAGRLTSRYVEPVPFSDGGRRSNVAYLALSVVILVVVGSVAYQWYHERNAPAPLAFVAPESTPEPNPSGPEASSEAPLAPLLSSAQPAAEERMLDAPRKEEPRKDEPRKAEEPSKAEEPRKPTPGDSHRLVFRLEREAWIEVRDGGDRILLAQLAPEGSERVVQGKTPIRVVIGNAQHVRLSVDGKPVELARHTKNDVARLRLP